MRWIQTSQTSHIGAVTGNLGVLGCGARRRSPRSECSRLPERRRTERTVDKSDVRPAPPRKFHFVQNRCARAWEAERARKICPRPAVAQRPSSAGPRRPPTRAAATNPAAEPRGQVSRAGPAAELRSRAPRAGLAGRSRGQIPQAGPAGRSRDRVSGEPATIPGTNSIWMYHRGTLCDLLSCRLLTGA